MELVCAALEVLGLHEVGQDVLVAPALAAGRPGADDDVVEALLHRRRAYISDLARPGALRAGRAAGVSRLPPSSARRSPSRGRPRSTPRSRSAACAGAPIAPPG